MGGGASNRCAETYVWSDGVCIPVPDGDKNRQYGRAVSADPLWPGQPARCRCCPRTRVGVCFDTTSIARAQRADLRQLLKKQQKLEGTRMLHCALERWRDQMLPRCPHLKAPTDNADESVRAKVLASLSGVMAGFDYWKYTCFSCAQVFTTEPLKKDSVCPQQHFKQETGCATCALYADKHGLHCAECERDPSLWEIKGTYWGKVYADAYKSRAGGGDLFNPGAARTLNFGALQKQRKPVLPAWAKVGQYLRRNPVTAPPSNARGLVGLVYDDRMTRHADVPGCEVGDRVVRIREMLRSSGLWDRCTLVPAREATHDELLAVHTRKHVQKIEHLKEMTKADIEGFQGTLNSIVLNQETPLAARLAAGSLVELCQRVMRTAKSHKSAEELSPSNSTKTTNKDKTVNTTHNTKPKLAKDKSGIKGGKLKPQNASMLRSGFAIIRPPGHHCEAAYPFGFCIYSNVAIAIRSLQKQNPSVKVLVVDWDVHHGNSTQHQFWNDDRVLYFSTHRFDNKMFFPGGACGDFDRVAGGFNCNVPWSDNEWRVGDAEYIYVWKRLLIPLAKAFVPDLVLVSAGFDSARGDPLGNCDISPSCYAYLTRELQQFADGRVVLALEGGYNLHSISISGAACVRALLNEDLPPLRVDRPVDPRVQRMVDQNVELHRYFLLKGLPDPAPSLLEPMPQDYGAHLKVAAQRIVATKKRGGALLLVLGHAIVDREPSPALQERLLSAFNVARAKHKLSQRPTWATCITPEMFDKESVSVAWEYWRWRLLEAEEHRPPCEDYLAELVEWFGKERVFVETNYHGRADIVSVRGLLGRQPYQATGSCAHAYCSERCADEDDVPVPVDDAFVARLKAEAEWLPSCAHCGQPLRPNCELADNDFGFVEKFAEAQRQQLLANLRAFRTPAWVKVNKQSRARTADRSDGGFVTDEDEMDDRNLPISPHVESSCELVVLEVGLSLGPDTMWSTRRLRRHAERHAHRSTGGLVRIDNMATRCCSQEDGNSALRHKFSPLVTLSVSKTLHELLEQLR